MNEQYSHLPVIDEYDGQAFAEMAQVTCQSIPRPVTSVFYVFGRGMTAVGMKAEKKETLFVAGTVDARTKAKAHGDTRPAVIFIDDIVEYVPLPKNIS